MPEYTVEVRAWAFVDAKSLDEAHELAQQLIRSLDIQDLEVVSVQPTKYIDPRFKP
jgi:hypothetical protein